MDIASEKDDYEIAIAPGDVDWSEDDWDHTPSQLAEEAANRIWDMPLCVIYERSDFNPQVAVWCEWIQQAIYDEWLSDNQIMGE